MNKILFTMIMLAGTVSFAGVGFDEVKPILKNNCTACHPGASSYKVAKGMSEKIYQMVVLEKEMPPKHRARLSEGDIQTLKDWIEGGASE